MAEFGWAYVAGGAITGAAGPTDSVLLRKGNTDVAGSSEFVYDTAANILTLSGSLTASSFVSASAYYGDGSNISNLPVTALNNQSANRLVSIGATTTQLDGEANLTFDGTTITLAGDMSGSGNISGSAFYGDGSKLTNVGSDLIVKEEGSNVTTAATSINFVGAFVTASNSGNDVTVTVNAGGGGGGTTTIGAAEDNSYADGLYTDFTNSTPIGTAVDRFNEVLKILAPSPAPSLSEINSDTSAGTTVKLSFGASEAVAGYTSSATAAGFSAIDIAGSYASATSGSNFRLGAYDGSQNITGFLNYSTVESVTNARIAFSNDAFANAETGSLKLELNGNIIHTVALSSLVGSGNPFSGSASSLTSGSGFTNVSVTASSFDGNNSEWYIFKHRTAKYVVSTGSMVPGWNYARAIHTVGATNNATNYVEWINDPSGAVNDLTISNGRIEEITLVGSKYLSGVEYNTDANAKYKADINNLYRNVYAASGTPISFGVANSSTPAAQSVPDLEGSDDNTKILGVTASLDYNSTSLLNGAITSNITVTHPFKNTISTTGSATTGNGFLIDNRSLASSNTAEKFHDETFRKISGSYDTQVSVTNAASTWNSQNHMTGGGASGHTDGLLLYNQRLYSPVDGDIPNAGNFGSLSNVEASQPNYSGVTGTRTFYRVLSNSSGADLFNFKIESTKNGTTYNNSSLSTANVHFFAKIPGATGWMDISQNFVYSNTSDGNGAKVAAASDSDTNVVTFGTASVANNNHIMLKILADESWAGYISQLDFTLPANQNQASPNALSDLEADSNTGTAAKLSFGSSNAIATYSNVQGGGIGSMSTINSNGAYTVSGNRRGVFTSAPTIQGELNEAISADGGGDFPAKAFSNAYTGSLVLEINGSDAHTVDLTSSLVVINTVNGNGSRLNISEVGYSTESNIPNYTKPYRTGSYSIAASDQRSGWNYARIKHVIGASTVTTNYVEWVVDPSGSTDNTDITGTALSDFGHTSLYYQSGIAYFAANPTGSYTFLGSNYYNNVYSNSSTAISFPTTTGCTVSNIRAAGSGLTTADTAASSIAMPALNNNDNCEITTLQVTGTITYSSSSISISGGLGLFDPPASITTKSQVAHPFKTNKTGSSQSKNFFMRYSGSLGSTTQQDNEYFNTETYRIVSGNYTSQTSLTQSANTWNSQTAMNNGGTHDDGMVTINGYALSPFQIGVAGHTGHSTLQSPAGNPDYSSLTNNTRTFYRYFNNNTSNDRSSITITLYGSGSLVKQATSLGANGNFYVEAKISGKTGWLDVGTAYASNNPLVDGAGALDGAAPGNPAVVIANGGTSVVCNFNGQSLLGTGTGPDYFALKISAHKDWIGYLSRVRIQYS